jgi:alanine racemase
MAPPLAHTQAKAPSTAVPEAPTSLSSALATPLPRVFQPRRTTPADVVRPTRAEISLSNLRANFRALERRCAVPAWCVLKADGYGHGAKACGRTLERAGAKGLCVALLEEGIELRNAGISVPVLVMGGFYGRSYAELLVNELTPVICDAGQIQELGAEARYRARTSVPIHLKLDTGMSRLGLGARQVAAVADALRRFPELAVEGLMTHFACPEEPDSVREQLASFEQIREALRREGISARYRHAANTAAILELPETHLDIVRPGIALFGVDPAKPASLEFKPVMRVLSTVVALRDLTAGQAVGYGATWRAARPTRLATLPIGYADGITRNSSNKRDVLVHGKRAPVVGTVSMDMITVDVTEVPGVSIGDEVVVMGSQKGRAGEDEITSSEIAAVQGTIPWEVLTQVSRRVPRFYRDA